MSDHASDSPGAPVAPLFADAMALRRVHDRTGASSASFRGNLGADWTIGPKVHGGVMVALCARAAREAYGPAPGTGGWEHGAPAAARIHPLAVSANFLSAPDPGEVYLSTTIRKRGRRLGLVDVELIQGQRACVHAVVTLGALGPLTGEQSESLFTDGTVAGVMTAFPPTDVTAIGPGHPAAAVNHLARGCDIRPQMVEAVAGGRAPAFRVWVRPRAGPVDDLFALMCGDISLPVPHAVGRRGWAPTVQLTAYLRGLPADGWLRVLCTASQVGRDWFDEDHTVVDHTGRLIVQTRQLALVPAE